MARLDLNRPYSTVHGETKGAAYGQDGHYFNHDGDEIDVQTGEIIDANDEPPVMQAASAPDPKLNKAPPTPQGVNLRAWGKGLIEYPFFKLARAIQETHHVAVQNKRDALDVLIRDGVIQPGEARNVPEPPPLSGSTAPQ